MKSNRLLIIPVLMILMVGCNSNRQHATVGGSQDTSSVTRGGGPPIADTSTINTQEKNDKNKTQAKDTAKKPTGPSTGNADPSGNYNKTNAKKP